MNSDILFKYKKPNNQTTAYTTISSELLGEEFGLKNAAGKNVYEVIVQSMLRVVTIVIEKSRDERGSL